MKLLVTGGCGFIGSNFILYWLKKYPNDTLVNIDKLTYAGNLANLNSIGKNPHYSFVKADITDSELVNTHMTGIDTVVHFAAESHVDRSIQDPSPFVTTNVVGTTVLLQAALKNKVKRFHHISTDEVFGSLPINSEKVFTLETPYSPNSPYAASKAASDHMVRAFYTTYGLPITISNCTNNYGPFHFPEKFIPLAITNILEEKHVPVYGDGKNVRDWLYVEDHCEAIDCVLQKGTIGSTYLVGGMTKHVDNLTLLKQILSLMNKNESFIDFVKDRSGHDHRYAIDATSTSELGWQPKHTLETGLKKTIAWYINNPDWWSTIKSGQYKHYYQQQYGS